MDDLNTGSPQTVSLRDAGRFRLRDALRDEGAALASICEPSKIMGAASADSARAMRSPRQPRRAPGSRSA